MARTIDKLAERFPAHVKLIRRLYLSDEQFRAICEDLVLSISSLRQFEARPDAHLRSEVDDYRTIIGELEDELHAYLASFDNP